MPDRALGRQRRSRFDADGIRALDRRRPGSLSRRRLGDARPRARPTAARLAPRRHPQARLASEMEKTEVEEEMLWGRRLRTGPLMSASVREKEEMGNFVHTDIRYTPYV